MNKYYKIFGALVLALSLNSCTEDVEPTNIPYATFEYNAADIGVPPGGEMTKDVVVYTANKKGSAREIDVVVSESSSLSTDSYTIPATITIPANSNEGVLSVVFKDQSLSISEDKVLNVSLAESTDIFTGDALSFNVSRSCATGLSKVKVNITLDNYPEEVYWRIKDSTDAVVMASQIPAGYGAYTGMSGSVVAADCLASGTYTFEIFDGYSDGAGKVAVTVNGATVFGSDGSYGAGTSGQFTID